MLNRMLFSMLLITCIFVCGKDSYAVTIGPTRLEASLPPGEDAGADYYVQNETEAPIHVTVEPENWAAEAYDYTGLDIKDWATIDCNEFDLKPKEIKKLKLSVKVPKNIKGEIVAQIFFTSSPIEGGPGAAGSVRSRLGSVLYISIKGTEVVKADIFNISASDMSDVEGAEGNIKFEILVRNGGNVHVRPASGEVVIVDRKGLTVAKMNMVTDHSILPNQEYGYLVMLEKKKLLEGKYNISADIKYGKLYGDEKTARLEKTLEVDKEGKVTVK